jgi:hypothetical protein
MVFPSSSGRREVHCYLQLPIFCAFSSTIFLPSRFHRLLSYCAKDFSSGLVILDRDEGLYWKSAN